jgi:hypothetical protein
MRRNREMRFHFAFLFLAWTLIPHFHLLVHSHAGGGRAHTHSELTKKDIRQLNRLEAAVEGTEGWDKPVERDSLPSAVSPVPAGPYSESTLADGDPSIWHSHSCEDPNITALGPQWDLHSQAPPQIVESVLIYLSPARAYIFPHPARGPPTSLFA